MIIGGLDIGTTGCKITAYDEKGNFIHKAYREYEVSRKNGMHEIDANVIFSAVCEVIGDTCQKYDLSAIGITSFGETFAVIDEQDNILMPSMLYTDTRGEAECEELISLLGEDNITSIVGVKPHQMYSLPKMMWIKNNRPDVFEKTKRIMLMEDFIVYMLTGNAYIDYSLAARTMAFDIRKKCWSEEILNAAGIDINLLSIPVKAFNIAGTIKPEIALRLGIKSTVKIVNGSHDQVASAVGSGIFSPGEAADGTGTVECVVPIFDKIPDDKRLYDEGYCVVPYVSDDTYVCYALSFTGGAALKWYKDNFAKEMSYSELDDKLNNTPTDLLIMPHFAGAANPYMDNASKATVLGLTLGHNAMDIYKALMEGVTYEIMLNIEHLNSFGIDFKKIYATGGGASSKVWLQIKADILNRPITSLEAKEVGACGTCMMVGVAIGIFKDLYEAKKHFVKEVETVLTNKKNTEKYHKLYSSYKKIYNAVKPITEEI